MECACWPIAYQRDVLLQEGRNIAVLVNNAGHNELRVMGGGASREVDPAYFCKAFDFPREIGWIYLEWIRWFRGLAEEVTTEYEIEAEFARLKRSGSHFNTGNLIRVPAAHGESVVDVAERMFQRLVVLPKLSITAPTFLSRVEQLVSYSEIEHFALFHRNVALEIDLPDGTRFAQLAYFSELARPIGIKVLRFDRRSGAEVTAQINDIRYSFGALVESQILEKSRCVVIHDEPKFRLREQVKRLEAEYCLLPLNDESGSSLLREMVLGR